jgi:hypothetical protein
MDSFVQLKTVSMLLLSSVNLLVHGNEVGYNLYVNDEGRYYFKPTTYANRNIFPPTFWVYRAGSQWQFEGIIDKEITQQAVEEISYYLNFNVEPNNKES